MRIGMAMRAVLQANRSGSPVVPPAGVIPPQKPFEFFVDYEYFTNVNVDFEAQWPTLDGMEIIFMIGLGWGTRGVWHYETFIAEAEDFPPSMRTSNPFESWIKAKSP